MENCLILEDAQGLLLRSIKPLPGETIPLHEAPRRILAADIFAPHDLPPHPQAAMDGFAIPCEGKMGSRFSVKENQGAGDVPACPLGPREAAGVLTGGHIPPGTAAVARQEDARVDDGILILNKEITAGDNIREQGEDFPAGAVIARRGTRITPGLIAVLAAFGFHETCVFRRPRVAILSLGKKIVPYHATPSPGQVRDSNGPLLAALADRAGGEITGVHAACTKPEKQIKELLVGADMVLTIGGTASGNNDPGHHFIERAGGRVLFTGYQVKPGSHTCAGILDGRIILMLSGNPVPCAVGYHILAAPVLRALQGLNPCLCRIPAVATNSFPKKGGPRRFLLGYALGNQKGWRVAVLPSQKSSMLRSLIDYNCLIDLPAEHPPVQLGDQVDIIPAENA